MEAADFDTINENINSLRRDILEIKARLDEKFELSDQAKRDLEKARKDMKKEFVCHDDIMKKYG